MCKPLGNAHRALSIGVAFAAAGLGCGGRSSTVATVATVAAQLAARLPELEGRLAPRSERWISDKEGLITSSWRPGAENSLQGFGARLPRYADGALEVGLGDGPYRRLRLVPEAALRGAPIAALAGHALHAGAWPSIDSLYVADADRVEAFYLLHDAAAPSELVFHLELPPGLPNASPDGAGGLSIRDERGRERLRVPRPFAVDARGTRRDADLLYTDGRLRVRLDPRGLVYPVLLDPSVENVVWDAIPNGAPAPPASYNAVMAYDAGRKVTVLVVPTTPQMTWEWNGTTWKSVSIIGPTFDAYTQQEQRLAMAYDGARGRMVIFHSRLTFLAGETWEYTGAPLWTRVMPSGSPNGRIKTSMTYDSARKRMVMYGGATGMGTLTLVDETWEYDGAAKTWAMVAGGAGSPQARAYPRLAYDTNRKVTVLFGGELVNFTGLGDTWEWDGKTWSMRATGPPARYQHMMTFDEARGRTLLFGGFSQGSMESPDLWEWDGTAWTMLAKPPFGGRTASAMSYDSGRGRTVLYGGYDSTNLPVATAWEMRVRGDSCTAGTQCDSGSCVNNVCCDVATCPVCQTCALKGSEGVCMPLLGAPDPNGCSGTKTCSASGTCVKVNGQMCLAATDCLSGFCTDGNCCEVPQCAAAMTCGTAGKCQAGQGSCMAPTDCTSGFCVTGYCCKSPSCAAGKEACGPLGDCLKLQGQTCTDDTKCITGHCRDGYCCSSACNGGPCQVCNGADIPWAGATNGICATAAAGVASVGGSCAPYLCDGMSPSCPTSCTATSQCMPQLFCLATGKCARQPQGASCASAVDCAGGLPCVDGVCCQSACAGKCQRCDVPGMKGSCLSPTGRDPDGDCPGDGACAGACAADGSCSYPGPSAKCDTCKACNAAGKCNQLPTGGDDPACGTVSCAGLSTDCRSYADVTAMRCTAIGLCAAANDPTTCAQSTSAPDGKSCAGGSCMAGSCALMNTDLGLPAADAGAGAAPPRGGCDVAGRSGRGSNGAPITLAAALGLLHFLLRRRRRSLLVLLALGMAAGGAGCDGKPAAVGTLASAVTVENVVWEMKSAGGGSTNPSAMMSSGAMMAYDANRKVSVLVAPEHNIPNTWEWNGTTWSQGPLGGIRSAGILTAGFNEGVQLAWDGDRARVVAVVSQTTTSPVENYEYDGVGWAPVATTGAPMGRTSAALAYDANRKRLVLFGGNLAAGTVNETWEYAAATATWMLVATTNPPDPAYYARLVYDSGRHVSVLFGGGTFDRFVNLPAANPTATWEWDGMKWSRLATTGPAARTQPMMVFDGARGRTILFGGRGAGPQYMLLNDLWEWDGNAWTELATSLPFGGRYAGAAAFDGGRGRIVLYGGRTTTQIGDVWEGHVRGDACSAGPQCDSGNCVNGVCCDSAMCPICQSCAIKGSEGACARIVSAPDPANRCSGTRTCDASGACLLVLGQPCGKATECLSGLCTDGNCCSVMACPTGMVCGPSGSCQTTTGKTCKMGSDCATGFCVNGNCCSVASCPMGKTCGPSGTCLSSLGTSCAAPAECVPPPGKSNGFCYNGYCCNSDCNGPCQACSGADLHWMGAQNGTCASAPAGSVVAACGSYLCDGVSSACPTSCASDAACAAHSFCIGGKCARRPPGGRCATTMDCDGALPCVDGVCCQTNCSSRCQRCDLAAMMGTCAVPVGKDPDGDCAGQGACAGACAGDGSCSFPGADTACDTCKACDKGGKCNRLPASGDDPACKTVACGGLSTECRSYADLTARRCVAVGLCASDNDPATCTLATNRADGTACSGGACASGVCNAAIDASAVDGSVAQAPRGGCSLAPRSASAPPALFTAALLGLCLTLRSRRRRAGSS